MTARRHIPGAFAMLIAAGMLWPAAVRGQTASTPKASAKPEAVRPYVPPRTPWGDPDLQGTYAPQMNDAEPVLEFACHEGNYAVRHILSGARAAEARH